MCDRVLGAPTARGKRWSKPDRRMLLETAAVMIRVLLDRCDPSRKPTWIEFAAHNLACALTDLKRHWAAGAIATVDEGLGLKRPAKWHRAATQRRARYRWLAAYEVGWRLKRGAKTPQVFHDIYESAVFPVDVSASQIEKWYYEIKKPTRRNKAKHRAISQRIRPIPEKTRRE
jgi:hypothetical protein